MFKTKKIAAALTAAGLMVGVAAPAHADAAADAGWALFALALSSSSSTPNTGDDTTTTTTTAKQNSDKDQGTTADPYAYLSAADRAKCPPTPYYYQITPDNEKLTAPVRGKDNKHTSLCLLTSDQARQAVFDAVNDLRKEKKVTPLVRTAEPDQKSQAWAERKARLKDLVHAKFDGKENATAGGENIVMCLSFFTPYQCVQWWRHSPGHYSNLMDPSFGSAGMGLGIDYSSDVQKRPNHYYFVQQFRVMSK
ncbi:MAG: CAP domain-containing protein [Corynebacterium sp.]|nr:CAP domain-containing protein [Corynebacterium sp.]